MSLSQEEFGKIKFMCRRGLKELDMILPAFVNQHLAKLNQEEMMVFLKLLELDDHSLLAAIINPAKGKSEIFISVCNKIKNKY